MSRSKTLDDASFEPHKAKTKKKSLGALYRVAKRTNPRAPHMTGVMSIQRDLIKQLVGDLRETDANEVKCQLAGWPNIDKSGKQYLTIELSPKFRANPQDGDGSDKLGFIFGED